MWSVLFALKTTISYAFYISSKVGHFIVTTLTSLFTNYLYLQSKLLVLVGVLLEDFLVFGLDVVRHISNCVSGVALMIDWLVHGLYAVFSIIGNFQDFICFIISGTVQVLLSILAHIGSIFMAVKSIVILFGDGVWFITMYIPKSVISLGPLTAQYVQDLCIQVKISISINMLDIRKSLKESLLRGFHFLTDVPLESLVGIIIAVCFFYIFAQFYNTLISYFGHMLLMLKTKLQSGFHRLRHRLRKCDNKTSNDENDDKMCIICQEEVKCIVTLPCRHLCLCTNCTRTLLQTQSACPMCRKPIKNTMKVFT